jgi:plastocyanin
MKPSTKAQLALIFILITGCLTGTSNSKQGQGVLELKVELTNFRIKPSTLRVEKGDFVRIIVNNLEGEHNIYISGYDLRTMVSNSTTPQILEFKADRAGKFEIWCEVRDHRNKGMTGELIVQ